MGSGDASAPCSTGSPPANAATTSRPLVMATHSENALGGEPSFTPVPQVAEMRRKRSVMGLRLECRRAAGLRVSLSLGVAAYAGRPRSRLREAEALHQRIKGR